MKSKFVILLCFLLLSLLASVNCEEVKATTSKQVGEKHEFQAEISKLLGIIINSLYTDKEIFLRELISNASDALDKIRYASLTNKEAFDTNPKLEIRIKADKEGKTLTISDTGVGMTKEDLKNNLGTLAKSGTKAFIEKLQKNSDYSLIGKFGVGFYSSFVVAHKVTVASKNHADDQFIWESEGDNSFVIKRDPRGNSLKRGTEITLHLKEKVGKEYLDQYELKNLIKKYSEFTHFPIYLWTERTETKEVPVEEEIKEEEKKVEEKKEGEASEEEKIEIKSEEKEEKKEPKTKKVEEVIKEWKHVNDLKPIWKREIKSIADKEYNEFYKKIGSDYMDPLTHIHFKVEGNIEFTALLFIPSKLPWETRTGVKDGKIKLYVRRVFIRNLSAEFFPNYLNWISGVVDSNDIPLHISRQELQRTKILDVIRKRLVKKILQKISRLAQDEEEEEEQYQQDKKEGKKDLKEPKRQYTQFYSQFEQKIKLGIIQDKLNQKKLADLIRFPTTHTGNTTISLEKYVARMKKDQKKIYYISGSSLKEVKNSPYLERLRDYEVIFFISPIDEYVLDALKDGYDEKKLHSISREGLEIESDKEKQEELKKTYESLSNKFTEVLGDKIKSLKFNSNMKASPVVLIATGKSITANMQRIITAQTMGDKRRMSFMQTDKILEVNPNHQVINHLNTLIQKGEDNKVTDYINILYDTALMRSGYEVADTKSLATRIFGLINSAISSKSETEKEEIKKVEENIKQNQETGIEKDEL